ncbi:hypothetical protein [Thermocatellispora tengchongensis]|uniref:hypothetical protein n=1 Tax=Thermocatellispora tengchongensis TaxID=1073253 RepID=UPI00362C1E29
MRRVELTEAGARLTDELATAGLDNLRRVLEQLDLDTLRALAQATGKIREAAIRLHHDPAPHLRRKVG